MIRSALEGLTTRHYSKDEVRRRWTDDGFRLVDFAAPAKRVRVVFGLLHCALFLGGTSIFSSSAAAQNSAQKPAPQSRSWEVSRSERVGRKAAEQQIRVLSKHPIIKTQFGFYATNLRTQFRHMLGLYDDDAWNIPLTIALFGTGLDVYSGDDVRVEAFIDEADQFAIRCYVRVHDRFSEEKFRLDLIRVLLLEQMLDSFSAEPGAFQESHIHPPDWLVHGFDRSLKHRELGRPSYFYSGLLSSGRSQWMKINEVVEPNRSQGLNALSLELFRASAAVLTGALCEQRGGGESMRGLLGDLAKKRGVSTETLIRKHFPALRETDQGIEKWWALQLASLAQQQGFEYFTPQETEGHLSDALEVIFEARDTPSVTARKVNQKGPGLLERLKSRAGKGKKESAPKNEPEFRGSIEDFEQFIHRPEARQVLAHRQAMLLALKVKAFPLYHDVIERYAVICGKLAKGDTKKVAAELAAAKTMRQQISMALDKTRDYLNYYEATRSPQRSAAFDSYLKFKEQTKKNTLPSRSDRISNYLDKVERQNPWLE